MITKRQDFSVTNEISEGSGETSDKNYQNSSHMNSDMMQVILKIPANTSKQTPVTTAMYGTPSSSIS